MTAENPLVRISKGRYREGAIVFVHGFGGDRAETWRMFPTLLADNLKSYDVYSFGYATRVGLDLIGLWSADPDIPRIAKLFYTAITYSLDPRHQTVAVIAHSMGGLAVQLALLDDPQGKLKKKVHHLFLFGTPSGGLFKAFLVSLLKRTARDMSSRGQFIKDLRQGRDAKYSNLAGKRTPFVFKMVAGEQDEFVPPKSSIKPFPEEAYPDAVAVVPGNHIEMVKPESAGALSVRVVLETLTQSEASKGTGPWNAARVAVELGQFRRAVELFEGHEDQLDKAALVQYALALESLRRGDDALEMLQQRFDQGSQMIGTDAMGVLAGRLKRRWLVERREQDALRARDLYSQAYDLSVANRYPTQAFYHGINVAFMELAFGNDPKAARRMATKVLQHCEAAPADHWRLATEGEANLYLGKTAEALERYKAAVAMNPPPRELDSMFKQARIVAELMKAEGAAAQLNVIFHGED